MTFSSKSNCHIMIHQCFLFFMFEKPLDKTCFKRIQEVGRYWCLVRSYWNSKFVEKSSHQTPLGYIMSQTHWRKKFLPVITNWSVKPRCLENITLEKGMGGLNHIWSVKSVVGTCHHNNLGTHGLGNVRAHKQ